jgi:hypothetical protein
MRLCNITHRDRDPDQSSCGTVLEIGDHGL